MMQRYIHFAPVSAVLLLLFLLANNVSGSGIALLIKLEGKKGAGNDIYLIGGKHCHTPTLIKKGKGKSKRGKIIIVEKECEKDYHDDHHQPHHYHHSPHHHYSHHYNHQNMYGSYKIPVFVPNYDNDNLNGY